jgi:large repetitive protein
MKTIRGMVLLVAFSFLASADLASGIVLKIKDIEPSSGPTEGGIEITLNGGFDGCDKVTLGGQPCKVISNDFRHIVFELPEGQGTELPVVVEWKRQTSEPVFFSYDAPVITDIDPATRGREQEASFPTQGGEFTLSGNNFGLEGQVTIGGTVSEIISWDHTQVVCSVPPGRGTDLPVYLLVGGRGHNRLGNPTYGQPIVLSYHPPEITAITWRPNDYGRTELTISGENFGPPGQGRVIVDDANCTMNSWGHTEIVCHTEKPSGLVTVTDIHEQTSASQAFSTSPLLESMTVTSAPTQGGTLLTLVGQDFRDVPGAVHIGDYKGVCEPIVSWDDTEIVCTIPPGQGGNLPVSVVMYSGSQSSNTLPFSYDPPSLTGISPMSGRQGTELTISGENFGSAAGSVTMANMVCEVISWDHTQIECTVPNGPPAKYDVTVHAGNQQGVSAGKFLLQETVMPPSPVLESIEPASGPSQGETQLLLVGQNFGEVPGAVHIGGISGEPCEPIISWNDSEIVCTIPAGQGANLPVIVRVAESEQTSNTLPFSYDPPFIESMEPASTPTYGSQLVLVGQNFGEAEGEVYFMRPNGNAGEQFRVYSWADSRIVCHVPAGQGENLPVVVRVAESEQTSNTLLFSYDPPQIDEFSPLSGHKGMQLTITGENFGLQGTVTVGDANWEIVSWNHTEIVCTVPYGEGTGKVKVISEGRSSTSTMFTYE